MNLQASAVSIALPATGNTDFLVIENRWNTKLCCHLAVAAQALDNFDVLVRAHPGATARDVTPTDWASLAASDYHGFKYASGNLAALAAAADGYFEMDITGLSAIILRASAAVDGAIITSRYSLYRP